MLTPVRGQPRNTFSLCLPICDDGNSREQKYIMIITTVAFIKYFLGVRRCICCYLILTIPGEVITATLD